ncbi:MAG: molybdate ABC transporter substrate-binding protein [Beijerinckiaceae bacterium]
MMPELIRRASKSFASRVLAAALCTIAGMTEGISAAEVRAAVAANFTGAAREIGDAYAKASGNTVIFSFGSTGQLYTQITQGAPFDVFLAADAKRPADAIAAGHGMAGTRFTYSIGRLALYSRKPGLVHGPETLRAGNFSKLAIANPVTAPYGAAAIEVMSKLGLRATLKSKLVQGANIAQTYQFVSTGNAELGFVAFSQITGSEGGSRWLVPGEFHTPIAQDAVLLARGANNPAARAFLDFLKESQALKIIERYGYSAGKP